MQIEWGSQYDALQRWRSQRLLTLAQTTLGERLLRVVNDTYDPTINPGHSVNAFRPLMVYGFSDMFYYVSTDGKAAIRAH